MLSKAPLVATLMISADQHVAYEPTVCFLGVQRRSNIKPPSKHGNTTAQMGPQSGTTHRPNTTILNYLSYCYQNFVLGSLKLALFASGAQALLLLGLICSKGCRHNESEDNHIEFTSRDSTTLPSPVSKRRPHCVWVVEMRGDELSKWACNIACSLAMRFSAVVRSRPGPWTILTGPHLFRPLYVIIQSQCLRHLSIYLQAGRVWKMQHEIERTGPTNFDHPRRMLLPVESMISSGSGTCLNLGWEGVCNLRRQRNPTW